MKNVTVKRCSHCAGFTVVGHDEKVCKCKHDTPGTLKTVPAAVESELIHLQRAEGVEEKLEDAKAKIRFFLRVCPRSTSAVMDVAIAGLRDVLGESVSVPQ